MKKLLLIFLCALITLPALALDFEYTHEGQTLKYETMSDTEVAVGGPEDISGDVIIPATVEYDGTEYRVTSIRHWGFFCCIGMTSVTIPNSVISIGDSAFSGCSGLTSLTIPSSVTKIYGGAFTFCTGLASIVVEDGNNSFCSVDGVLFNKEKTTLLLCPPAHGADYVIPSSVTTIGEDAFYGCHGLTSLTIPNSVTEIGDWAFSHCTGLTSVTIPNSVTEIGWSTFCGCNGLTSVTIPNSVTSIGDAAFSDCSDLTAVTIPNSVTKIGDYAFKNCGLTAVTIPNSVTSIDWGAFHNCSGLTAVYYDTEKPIIGEKNIFNCENDKIYKNATLYVPEQTVDKCKTIDPWMNFLKIEACDFSGIEEVNVDMDAPYDVYTIGGQKAGSSVNGLAPGIYIVRQGDAVKKIAIK